MPFIIFNGNDIKVLRREVRKYEKSIVEKNPNIDIYAPENPTLSEILNKISSASLFSNSEIIKIYDFDKIPNITQIYDYNVDNYYLILMSNKDRIPAKMTKKNITLIKTFNLPRDYEIEKLIFSRYGNKFSPEVTSFLSRNITSIIDLEELVDKMEKDDINYLNLEDLYKIKGDTEAKIFLIIDDIINKKINTAIIEINSFLDSGGYIGQIISLLSSQLNKIYSIKKLKSTGTPEKEIASILGGHPFVVKKLIKTSSLYTLQELEKLIIDLPEMDFNIKSNGPTFSRIFIENFILQLKK